MGFHIFGTEHLSNGKTKMSGKLELEVSEHSPLFKKILEGRGVKVINKDGSTNCSNQYDARAKNRLRRELKSNLNKALGKEL